MTLVFKCQTRVGNPTYNPTIPSTISCQTNETLVSCGVSGIEDLQGTYIDPQDPNTCIAGTSSSDWYVTAVANCCEFPEDSINSISTITNDTQIGKQVLTKCPFNSVLTGCQVNYQSGLIDEIRGSYSGPQQSKCTPPASYNVDGGVSTQNQCVAESRSSGTFLRGGAQCISTTNDYHLGVISAPNIDQNSI